MARATVIHSTDAVQINFIGDEGDMYSAWRRCKGDASTAEGAVIVWGARSPEILALFDAPVVAVVALDPVPAP